MKIEIKRMVLGPVQTNVYYVINPETKECVILDPADNAPRIRMAVNKLGVTPVAILLTHGHFDHIDAADEVRKMFDIKIYALDKEQETLADPYLNGDARFYRKHLSISADVWLHDGEVLDLFQASFGRYDMPGGCFTDLQKSLKEKLFLLPDDVTVFPGHMEETSIGFEKRYNPIL